MKKLLSVLLIFVLIFTFCSCSSTQSNENALIGCWETIITDSDGWFDRDSYEFNNDGTMIFSTQSKIPNMNLVNLSETYNYTVEEDVLHVEPVENDTFSVDYYYRFNDDKTALYLKYGEDGVETKYKKVDAPTEYTDKKDNKKSTNKNNDYDSDADFTPIGYDENIIGDWECESGDEENPYYSACFFDDETGTIFVDCDYVITGYCCVDNIIIADLEDGSSMEIPYRYNKNKTSLYLTLPDGEIKFDKAELGIG